MISKVSLWEERDKAISDGEDKLNNKNLFKYTTDKDADYGCKGKDDYWYGYKRGLFRKTPILQDFAIELSFDDLRSANPLLFG